MSALLGTVPTAEGCVVRTTACRTTPRAGCMISGVAARAYVGLPRVDAIDTFAYPQVVSRTFASFRVVDFGVSAGRLDCSAGSTPAPPMKGPRLVALLCSWNWRASTFHQRWRPGGSLVRQVTVTGPDSAVCCDRRSRFAAFRRRRDVGVKPQGRSARGAGTSSRGQARFRASSMRSSTSAQSIRPTASTDPRSLATVRPMRSPATPFVISGGVPSPRPLPAGTSPCPVSGRS